MLVNLIALKSWNFLEFEAIAVYITIIKTLKGKKEEEEIVNE